jgi:hydroxyacylglutathione hydrolase
MNMRDDRIIPVKLGITYCYLIRGGTDYIMVDAGPPNTLVKFRHKLDKLGIVPARIKQIFITHIHFDHMGSLAGICELTGAKSVMHHLDREDVEKGMVNMPRGMGALGKMLTVFLLAIKPLVKRAIDPVPVDRELGDRPFSLSAFQIRGKVLHTPGHTKGSISLILDSGEAFVGDLAMSGLPRLTGPGPFVLGDDLQDMKMSWRRLLDEGTTKIFPAHGKPFSAKVFEKYLKS